MDKWIIIYRLLIELFINYSFTFLYRLTASSGRLVSIILAAFTNSCLAASGYPDCLYSNPPREANFSICVRSPLSLAMRTDCSSCFPA